MNNDFLLPPPQLFQSFWIGGYESSCHRNRHGERLDLIAATQHDRQVQTDYALLRAAGIHTARDAVRWPLIEKKPGEYDFSSVIPMLEAAKLHQVQVIWDICHYGWPDDIDLLSPEFVTRFARFSTAFAELIKAHAPDVPFYSPINEISFFAWAAGDSGVFHPFLNGRGADVKRQLVRAALAGMDAIWAVDPRARFVHVDPIIRVIPKRDEPHNAKAAADYTESQYEAWDMIAGKVAPELGGAPKYLDIIGANYYHSNQWEYGGERLRWEQVPRDDRWMPFHQMLAQVYRRYRCSIFVGETSHFGVGRGDWIAEIASELCAARAAQIPIAGVCIYPIIDRMDWEDATHWHNSGLWDLKRMENGSLQRVLNEEYAAQLRRAQLQLSSPNCIQAFASGTSISPV